MASGKQLEAFAIRYSLLAIRVLRNRVVRRGAAA